MATIIDIFKDNVKKFGSKPCLRFKHDGKWRFLDWVATEEKISLAADGLATLGVKPSDRVGILSSTRFEWTIADMAVLFAGGVVVPFYQTLSAAHIADIVNETEISTIFVENEGLFEKLLEVKRIAPSLKNVVLFSGAADAAKLLGSKSSGLNIFSFERLFGLGASSRLIRHEMPRHHARESDLATIIYTSGTTGRQKGVMLTHKNIVAEVESCMHAFILDTNDVMLCFLPLAHVLGRAMQYFHLAHGCSAAYAESVEKLPDNFLEVRPHMTVAVPRFLEKVFEKINDAVATSSPLVRKLIRWGISTGEEYSRLTRHKERVPFLLALKHRLAALLVYSKLRRALGGRIKFIVTGGAPFSEKLAKFYHAAGLLVIEGWGLTETTAAITVNRLDDYHFGTVGKPLPGVELKLAEDNEILVRGDMVFKGYFKRDEETKESFDAEGWFKTGDIGEFSRDGFLRLTDRKKDIIVTANGKNIAPQLIERALCESPYIRHAVIFGDGRKFISALVSLDNDRITEFARERGIAFSRTADLYAREEIKKLISGVIEEKNRTFSQFETIKKFAILDCDFTIENGELTPTMKVRRRLIESKFAEVVDGLYTNG